jgi:3'-phosphoadenosine 5'-phosphosulfate sulfotransferase (PAPS reductase)/FAD synthetase
MLSAAKKWLWLRKRVIYASLSFTATIMLALLSIDPSTRESERALYILLALFLFALSIWLWLKQIEFVDEYIEEYEFITFPIEKEEPQPQPIEPQPAAQPEPPKRANVKPWCTHCGSAHVIVKDKRLYCLDCGQISKIQNSRVLKKVKGA